MSEPIDPRNPPERICIHDIPESSPCVECDEMDRVNANEKDAELAALRARVAELEGKLATLWECETCGLLMHRQHENADGSGFTCPDCEADEKFVLAALREIGGKDDDTSP